MTPLDRLTHFWTSRLGIIVVAAMMIGYTYQMGLRPQTLYGIADSPIGLAAYFLDHDARSYALIARVFDGQTEGLTRDDVLDNITIACVDEHGSLGRPSVLGSVGEAGVLQCQRRHDTGCRERLS